MHLNLLNKPIPCRQEHKLHHNMLCPNVTHVSEDTKGSSTCVDQTHSMQRDTKFISTCVDQTFPMPARTQNVSQNVLPKTSQQGNKVHLNICGPKSFHASKDIKCTSTCVGQTPPMPAGIQNATQYVLTKPIPCQRGHKIHLNLCWPNPSHASNESKCITICVDQTHPLPSRTQNLSQLGLPKFRPWKRGQNIISTSVD
jgi:hypothetical protein